MFKPSLVKSGRQKGGQALSERVDEEMSHVLCSRTELKHRQNLRQGIDGQPEPEHLSGTAEPRPQFIQLEMREPEGAEEALMQGLCVLESRVSAR
jgi:hypothetical protein